MMNLSSALKKQPAPAGCVCHPLCERINPSPALQNNRAPRGFLRLLFVLFARENIDAEGIYHQKAAPLGVKPRSARDRTGARRASEAQQKPRKFGDYLLKHCHIKNNRAPRNKTINNFFIYFLNYMFNIAGY